MMYRAKIMNIEAFELGPDKPFPKHFQPSQEVVGVPGDMVCRDQNGKYFVISKDLFEKAYEPLDRNISSFEMRGNF